jgi:hypothetical protein
MPAKNSVIVSLKKKIAKLKVDIEDCRGCGNVSSDYGRMNILSAEIRGLQYAVRVIQRRDG